MGHRGGPGGSILDLHVSLTYMIVLANRAEKRKVINKVVESINRTMIYFAPVRILYAIDMILREKKIKHFTD